jgi:hypothetical protein
MAFTHRLDGPLLGRKRWGIALFASLSAACGTDVDLGGTSDGGLSDGHVAAAGCAPCAAASDCLSGVCGQFAGDLFCGTPCTGSTGCLSGESCMSVPTSAGGSSQLCVPESGACAPAEPPPAADGAVLETCGDLNGPNVSSECKACGKYSNDCQPNGCYGGYWCDEPERDCQPPPKSCP